MKKNILIILAITFSSICQAQDYNITHSLVFKISLFQKLKLKASYGTNLVYRLHEGESVAVTPYVDFKFTLFNNHLGESITKSYGSLMSGNVAITFGSYLSIGDTVRYQYLPQFSPTYANTFQEMRNYSIGLGKTFIMQSSLRQKPQNLSFIQSVGSFSINIREFYINYYNDGGYGLSLIGDGYDRYWTSGLVIGFTNTDVLNGYKTYEASFEKFTGFSKGAYKVGGLIGLENVLYKRPKENTLNSGQVSFSYRNFERNIYSSINLMNLPSDPQDWIHKYVTGDPFHEKKERFYVDFTLGYNSINL